VTTRPVEIRLKRAERRLELAFEDGQRLALDAELLRAYSPSAEVKGHTPGLRPLAADCSRVGILAVEPIGLYALRIVFDDGHDTGIYSFDYLLELWQKQDALRARYQEALRGSSREGR
jgi:DUF971 family protein